ncbi:DEAD/DEAH box helicase family protein, partial [Clostridium botulinum]
MFLESESNLMKCISDNIFYLEAPTGSGKSNTSLNLALNILNNSKQFNKIISVNPYNAISEQTYNNTRNSLLIDDKDVVLINSQTEIIESDIEDETHYSKDFLDNQLLNYPVSIISHVKLFKALFSNNRIDNLMLFNIINSVIIIDEVQSYKNNLWIHII